MDERHQLKPAHEKSAETPWTLRLGRSDAGSECRACWAGGSRSSERTQLSNRGPYKEGTALASPAKTLTVVGSRNYTDSLFGPCHHHPTVFRVAEVAPAPTLTREVGPTRVTSRLHRQAFEHFGKSVDVTSTPSRCTYATRAPSYCSPLLLYRPQLRSEHARDDPGTPETASGRKHHLEVGETEAGLESSFGGFAEFRSRPPEHSTAANPPILSSGQTGGRRLRMFLGMRNQLRQKPSSLKRSARADQGSDVRNFPPLRDACRRAMHNIGPSVAITGRCS